MVVVVFAAVAFVWLVVGALIWNWYQSNGRKVVVTVLETDDVVDEAIRFFVPGGWKVEQGTDEFVFMRRGASGCTSLLFLVLFFPLGLVYLFTDWGKGNVRVSARNYEDGTRVEIDWQNAFIREGVVRLIDWYAAQVDSEEHEPEQADHGGKRSFRRRK